MAANQAGGMRTLLRSAHKASPDIRIPPVTSTFTRPMLHHCRRVTFNSASPSSHQRWLSTTSIKSNLPSAAPSLRHSFASFPQISSIHQIPSASTLGLSFRSFPRFLSSSARKPLSLAQRPSGPLSISSSRFLWKQQLLQPGTPHVRALFGAISQNLLARMEQTANNNPTSPTAQLTFYTALMRSNMPAIVVERYETGRFATNPACEDIYLRASEQVGSGGGEAATLQGQSESNNMQEVVARAVAAQARGGSRAKPRVQQGSSGAKDSPIYVVVDESLSEKIFKYLRFFFSAGITIYLVFVMLQFALETTSILRRGGPGGGNEAQAQHQTVRFSDVHGCDEAKDELQELVEFLKNPEKFSTLGGKLPKGVLLMGPPGTGKTLLARAVAGEAGVPFFFMSGAEFDEMYVGVGAKRVRDLFNNARAKAPAIIFIDELDAIGTKRNERDPAYAKQSLNQLLTELDGFSQETGIIILAATNFPQLLDKALTRPGRFDRNVVVPLPDVRGRMAILKHHMKNVPISPEVDESAIARTTTGFSGADLENLVNQAAVRASRNQSPKVGMVDLEWAKDKIIMGAERRSAVIQDKDKLMTAYHEAGHALTAMFTKHATPLYKVTIMPRGQALGVTSFLPEMDQVSQSKAELLSGLDVAMGGKVAEEIIYGPESVTSGCSSDLTNATNMAFRMITQFGMSPLGDRDMYSNYSELSSETKQQIENELQKMMAEARSRSSNVLNEHREELDTLAKALVEYELLSFEEVNKILKGEKLTKLKASKGGGIKVPQMPLPPSGGIAMPGTALPGKPPPSDGGARGGEAGQGA